MSQRREDEGILDKEIRMRAEYEEIIEKVRSLRDNDGEPISQGLINRLIWLRDRVGI